MKKLTAFIAMLLIVAMLAGCGGTSGTASKNEEGEGAASGEKDVIEIVSWWDENPVGGDKQSDLAAKRKQDIEKKYNVEFKYTVVPADDIAPRFITEVMSGGSLGDLVNMRHYWAFPDYAAKNYLLNISDYLDIENQGYREKDLEIATYDGSVYGIPSGDLAQAANIGYLMYINKKYFPDTMSQIYDMFRNKTWTWDAVMDLAKKQTKVGTDGNVSVYGLSMLNNYAPVEVMVASFGGTYMQYVNGEAKSTVTSPNVTNAIDLVRKAVFDDKISPSKSEGEPTAFKTGKYAMYLGSYYEANEFKEQMEDDFGIMPVPLGGDQTEYVNFVRERHFKVASATANKERMKKILKIYNEYSAPFENQEDLLTSEMEAYTCDEESVEVLREINKDYVVPEYYDKNTEYWNIVVVQGVQKALGGSVTSMAAMKAIDDAWQAAISQ